MICGEYIGKILNPNIEILMAKIQSSKRYDLEERTFKFSRRVRNFIKKVAEDGSKYRRWEAAN